MTIKQPFKEKYYICPNCGELSTLSQQLETCSNGGMPYCYCEYDNGRIFIEFKRISKILWGKLRIMKNSKERLSVFRRIKT